MISLTTTEYQEEHFTTKLKYNNQCKDLEKYQLRTKHIRKTEGHTHYLQPLAAKTAGIKIIQEKMEQKTKPVYTN